MTCFKQKIVQARLIALVLGLFLLPVISWAQTAITGTVTDAAGETVIGANVVERGTRNSTVTDINGRFTLTVADGAVLQVSFLGYATQEVAARPNMTVTLTEDAKALGEVVVVGYGTLDKRQVTSSVTSITARELPQGMGGTTIANALSGKVGGLVMHETPSPNSSLKLQLRCMASVNAESGPLVVIDGMPGGDIRSVVQEDIQSIDILKDASGGAIYGSRATGGVILITTKQAKEGKMKLTYTGEVIFKNTFAKPDIMTAQEFRKYNTTATD